nr:MmgE/PrpD family protein [Deltaproteobacteria bacterium]
MNYTQNVAEFVALTAFESIPPAAIEETKRALLDCLGVMLAGSREESARICAKLAREESTSHESTVV